MKIIDIVLLTLSTSGLKRVASLTPNSLRLLNPSENNNIERKLEDLLQQNRQLVNDATISKIPNYQDIPDDFWSTFGECIVGDTNGAQIGQAINSSPDGKQLLSAAFSSVQLYDYTRETGWSTSFDFTPLLVNNDGAIGYKAALSQRPEIGDTGKYLVVGSPNNNAQGADTGAVQVFERVDNSWRQYGATIIGDKTGDQFGFSVSLTGFAEKVLVGAPGGGYARTYKLSGGGIWESTDILGDSLSITKFGFSTSISGVGGVGVVGSPGFNANTGKARVYDLKDQEFAQQISGDIAQSQFGSAVAMSLDGNTFAVSSSINGFVRVYRYDDFNNFWNKIGFDIIIASQEFGSSISISETGLSMAVGAPKNSFNGPDAGASYMFEYEFSPVDGVLELGGQWNQKGDPFYGKSLGDGCGTSVYLSPNGKRFFTGCPGVDTGGVGDTGAICGFTSDVCPDDDDCIFPSTQPSVSPTSSPTISFSPTVSFSPTKTVSPSNIKIQAPTSVPSRQIEGPTNPNPNPVTVVTSSPSIEPEPPSSLGTAPTGGGTQQVAFQIALALAGMFVTFFGGICAGGCLGGGALLGFWNWEWFDWGWFSGWWYESWH